MNRMRIGPLLIALALLLPGTQIAGAAPSATYGLATYTIDGGGQLRHDGSGRFQLSGTVGQAESSALTQNERYTLSGGFWQPAKQKVIGDNQIFLPLVSR